MKQPKQTGKRQTANSLSSYVYVIRVDGVVRYIGKGRNGRLYSHMIEAQRTANRPGVKIANLSPHFRKMLVSAVRRGANIKEKIITAKLTADAAYAMERHMKLSQKSSWTALEHYRRKVHECRIPSG